ncbi:MAG TPA: KpsF/GutQ family sugar-phosphate isomerase [Tepidisphaeraceae bacterium]|nr:KpsF/GutQ family sugar-phosphate isomerase [Tepidisphaeraceae bacterium]
MTDPVIEFGRQVIQTEGAAVRQMADCIGEDFVRAVNMVLDCPGAVLATGVGKAGIIARKLSSTLASTGTPSHVLSAADAVHGDLGSIRQGDLIVILSSSGESDEILRVANLVRKLGHPIIAATASRQSTLGKSASVVLEMGKVIEACPLGLAPSASTTALLALCDALALTVMKLRKFGPEDFAMFHPAGQLGRQLLKVGEAMTFRRGENLPVASDALSVRQVMHDTSAIKRRPGAVILVSADGRISGIFTDADLRRLLTDSDTSVLDKPMHQVMTRHPSRVREGALASEAMALMRQKRIDELPVVNDRDEPVGLIDVQDLVVLKIFDVERGCDL